VLFRDPDDCGFSGQIAVSLSGLNEAKVDEAQTLHCK
jgi:hypothetical protein